jgi:dATP pyrophosphohydrolase
MRAPFQILVIPYRRSAAGPEYAVLRRTDTGYWQFVAGGGEDEESPVQAAKRETKEEIGIDPRGRLLRLNFVGAIPKNCFAAADSWEDQVHSVPEYCFGIDVGDSVLTLSDEHTEVRWLTYDKADDLLHWDSNRAALRELDKRLTGRADSQTL